MIITYLLHMRFIIFSLFVSSLDLMLKINKPITVIIKILASRDMVMQVHKFL